ncbi:MAG: ribbon-helix-helix domain-containing protein [Alphaproteobacteria bacterium]|nr:ribbon-helix-helix domain-containing protein [Alphaproteobacteria bacterium]
MTGLRKRSVMVSGHATSVSLEQEFWEELQVIARAKGVSLNRLVSEVDRTRTGNLSSALRVFVLAALRRAGRDD